MLDVLVAHHDSLTRALVRSTLEECGFLVREAASAKAALDACQERAPEVALIESGLCSREAMPLIAKLKQDPHLFTIAVVLITDTQPAAEVLEQLDRGAQDVLMTPIQEADLVARVRSAARTKALQEELLSRGRVMEDLAYGDPLTKLYNRRFIFMQLAALVASVKRHRRALSVCVIDIDRFKDLNDTLGHAAGDQALVEVARRLQHRVRQEDFLGRIGGEEFVVLLPETSGCEAARVAEDLRAVVSRMPIVVEGISRTVTVSVGWATWRSEEDADSLLRRADHALYRAKAAGRDRVCGDDEDRSVDGAAEAPKRFVRGSVAPTG